ncbi:putative GPI anchored glycoprotein [Aspergillus clavatus NRRL 1]|uniref:GPI anchored glycoprotein, putative n=1 Tax=Aspergillus clavatus (strain ATCC 1007 / CBS 513.65 / DSM 816 / NCTC 3887 / NRRL 1 / QM 1276 / 107) TaxID=344612 RepID=A1C430_ASPCL|nr:GPI anchored glycoprotein, putative [Aspergillus clavatus NRRL 1]EAW15170.1 GPI anchored glycoprotein, putative [Aspergillus clavatus NRRL 1]
MRSATFRSFALLAATAATVTAESTVTLFLPAVDTQSIQAKVVGSSDSATTYVLNCAPGTSSEDCGIPADYTVIQGPSTYQQVMSYDDYYVSYGCKLAGTTSVSCMVSQKDATTTHVDSTAVTESIPEMYRTVVVTGTGAASVPASTGASPTAATATATTGSVKTTLSTSGSAATGSSAASSGASSAVASHSSSGNAAMPQVTGRAQWVVGGAAVALAMAMA